MSEKKIYVEDESVLNEEQMDSFEWNWCEDFKTFANEIYEGDAKYMMIINYALLKWIEEKKKITKIDQEQKKIQAIEKLLRKDKVQEKRNDNRLNVLLRNVSCRTVKNNSLQTTDKEIKLQNIIDNLCNLIHNLQLKLKRQSESVSENLKDKSINTQQHKDDYKTSKQEKEKQENKDSTYAKICKISIKDKLCKNNSVNQHNSEFSLKINTQNSQKQQNNPKRSENITETLWDKQPDDRVPKDIQNQMKCPTNPNNSTTTDTNTQDGFIPVIYRRNRRKKYLNNI